MAGFWQDPTRTKRRQLQHMCVASVRRPRAIGVTLPRSLILRADEVIE
jgi:hypothetical protein